MSDESTLPDHLHTVPRLDGGEWVRCATCGATAETADHLDHVDDCPDASDRSVEIGTCHVCDSEVSVDGEQAIERFGNVLCRDCSDEPVVLRATCDNKFCSWSVEREDTEFNRGHLDQLVRNKANTHERTKRIFDDDPMHSTTVEEVLTDE